MCKATFQSHNFWRRSWWLVFVCLFVCAFVVFLFFCLFLLFCLLLFCYYFYLFVFLQNFGDGGMGVEALFERYWSFSGEQGIVISAGQSNWEVFWFGWVMGRFKIATCRCGKNKWVGIGIKLCWSGHKF